MFYHFLLLLIGNILLNMELRISELARQRGMTIADIAKQIGISRVNLSNSLNGNPTLFRLKEVAEILHVEVSELFKKSGTPHVSGYLEYGGNIVKVESIEAIKDFVRKIEDGGEME